MQHVTDGNVIGNQNIAFLHESMDSSRLDLILYKMEVVLYGSGS